MSRETCEVLPESPTMASSAGVTVVFGIPPSPLDASTRIARGYAATMSARANNCVNQVLSSAEKNGTPGAGAVHTLTRGGGAGPAGLTQKSSLFASVGQLYCQRPGPRGVT